MYRSILYARTLWLRYAYAPAEGRASLESFLLFAFFPFCPSLALAFLPVLSSSIPFYALNGRNLELLNHLIQSPCVCSLEPPTPCLKPSSPIITFASITFNS